MISSHMVQAMDTVRPDALFLPDLNQIYARKPGVGNKNGLDTKETGGIVRGVRISVQV
jgi:hypothetical protein